MGDVIACNRGGRKLYSVVLGISGKGDQEQLTLSKFSPCVGFEPMPHKVRFNLEGWLEDEHERVLLGYWGWDSTKKGLVKNLLSQLPTTMPPEKKNDVLTVLFLCGSSMHDGAEAILERISLSHMPKAEAVDLLANVLRLTTKGDVWRL